MRRWDASKGAWETLDDKPVRYWDHGKGAWVVDPSHSPKESYEVSSCEIPMHQVPKTSKHVYTVPKPWDSVDRVKFPETWKTLVMLYYAKDWHSGKYIPESDYINRITKGIYVPEPKGWRDWHGDGNEGNPYYMGD